MFEESVTSLPSIWASMNSWFTPTVLFLLLNVMIGTIAIASHLGSTQKHQDPQQHQNHHQGGGLARSPSMLQRLKSINLYQYRSPEPHATTFEQHPETTEATHYAFNHTHELEQLQLTRSPSLLQRLKSINFYPSQPTAAAAPPHKTHEPESHFEQAPEHDEFPDDDRFEEHEHPEPETPDFSEAGDKQSSLEEVFSQLKPLQDHHVNRTKSDTKPASGEVPAKLPKKMKKSASSKSAFAHFQEDDVAEIRRPATMRERKVAKAAEDDDEVDAKADDFINRFKNQLKLQRLDSIIRYKDMITRGSDK
ncbi:pathogen-associated molecular patterns-induced protein A70-like [Pyrus communis]|uniref:pathogen-associated molecular patterns-induced protein A70-like n=1 Tax=Pyrus communis TaxID=23211 RepID=UPI0035C01604